MPLFTRPHFSDKQIVQFPDEVINLSGETNFIGTLKSKNTEIDAFVSNPSTQDGYVLKFDQVLNKIILLPDDSGVAGLTNAENGLDVLGSTVVLGGTLLSGTTININGFPFILTGGTLSLQDLEIQGIGIDTTPINNTQDLYLKYNSGTNKFEPAELVIPDTILAENGLTKINNVVVLGGSLLSSTTIQQSGFPFVFTGDTVFVQAFNIDGVGITLKPVNNTQDLYLKYNSGTNRFEPAQLVIPNVITANNGLSKIGDNISLGGTLLSATTIQQNGFPLILTGGTLATQRLEVQGIEIDTTPVNNNQNLFLKYNSGLNKFEPSEIVFPSQIDAFNGLSLSGDSVILGGDLVDDTEINLGNKILSFIYDNNVVNYSIFIDSKFLNYGANYHPFYDNRTLVDKEYVDIEVFDSINDNFVLSGATNGMALVFNSSTTKYQPSFVDYNTLLNLPVATLYGNTLFVSPNGNNTTATIGRFDRPYLTIQAAINASPANGSICIVEGTYSESLSINKVLKLTSLGRVQISGTHTITSTSVEFDNIRLKQASVAAIFTATSSTITVKNSELDTAGTFVASATGTSTIIARNVYSNKQLTNGTFTNERPFNFAVDATFVI